jgi:uncharacterized repeat protein (TIGR03843 family)
VSDVGASDLQLLREGELEVQGRLVEASNATLYCSVRLDGVEAECVYKPVRGERPLWDFPDGTLAGREVAAARVAEALGWELMPPTVLREGPFGSGMVQRWVPVEEDSDLVDLFEPEDLPKGWLPVLRALGERGEPVVLAHADHPLLRRLAVLDVVINNADRKAGHILHTADGRVLGIDHGVTLNVEDKLRTVLWGFRGQRLPDEAVDRLGQLRALLEGSLAKELVEHITPQEVEAISERVDRLLGQGVFPGPSGEWPAIPWPPF